MCVRACVCHQITGGSAVPASGGAETRALVWDALYNLYSLPEMRHVPTYVFVEANNQTLADLIADMATQWWVAVTRRDSHSGVRAPGVVPGEVCPVYRTTTSAVHRNTLFTLATTSANHGASGDIPRGVGYPTTDANKKAGALRLRTMLEQGCVRFHSGMRCTDKNTGATPGEAVGNFLQKLITQLYSFKYETTPSGGVRLSGKQNGANDDLVMALMFLVTMTCKFVGNDQGIVF